VSFDPFGVATHTHQQQVDRVADDIRECFGKQAMRRGGTSSTSPAKPLWPVDYERAFNGR